MKAYLSLFKIRFVCMLQYRTAAIAGVLTQFAFGFMYIMLYLAFYESGVPSDFSAMQMVSYIWLGQAFYAFFYWNAKNSTIISQIEDGDICYQMIRPMNLYGNWFCTIFAEKVASTLLRGLPILIIAFCLPAGWGLGMPASVGHLFLSIISLALGGVLVVSACMICYCLLFQTMSSLGIFSIFATICSLCSGTVVPIPLMPKPIQTVLNFLPFRYTSDLTFRIYGGNLSVATSAIQIAIQIAWITFFVLIGMLYLKKNLKKVEVQGG